MAFTKVIASLAFWGLCLPVKSQYSLGVWVGCSNNRLNTNLAGQSFAQNKNGKGYITGIVAKYQFNKLLELSSSLLLVQKNHSIERTNIYQGIFQSSRNTYLQIPLTINVNVIHMKRTAVYFSAGVFAGYWAFANINGQTPDVFNITDSVNNTGQITQSLGLTTYSHKYNFNNQTDNRFEFGWVLGTGINFYANKRYTYCFDMGLNTSLTSQEKKYMLNAAGRYNHAVAASIALLYSFR